MIAELLVTYTLIKWTLQGYCSVTDLQLLTDLQLNVWMSYDVCVMTVDRQLGDGTSLTYEAHLLLWLHWLPAVEAELLAIISWVYETPVTSRDILLRRCQNLVSHTSNLHSQFCWCI